MLNVVSFQCTMVLESCSGQEKDYTEVVYTACNMNVAYGNMSVHVHVYFARNWEIECNAVSYILQSGDNWTCNIYPPVALSSSEIIITTLNYNSVHTTHDTTARAFTPGSTICIFVLSVPAVASLRLLDFFSLFASLPRVTSLYFWLHQVLWSQRSQKPDIRAHIHVTFFHDNTQEKMCKMHQTCRTPSSSSQETQRQCWWCSCFTLNDRITCLSTSWESVISCWSFKLVNSFWLNLCDVSIELQLRYWFVYALWLIWLDCRPS